MQHEFDTLMADLRGCAPDVATIATLAKSAWEKGQYGLALELARDAWRIARVLKGV